MELVLLTLQMTTAKSLMTYCFPSVIAMEINREHLRKVLADKGINQIYIDEIDECIRITQILDQYKRTKGLPSREDWDNYKEQLKIGN
jgi:hypothetical protein